MLHSPERHLTVSAKAEISKNAEDAFEEEAVLSKEDRAGLHSDILIFLWTTFSSFVITKTNDDAFQLFLPKLVYQLIILSGGMRKNHMQVFILSPYEKKQFFIKEKKGSDLFSLFNICLKQAHHTTTINLKHLVYVVKDSHWSTEMYFLTYFLPDMSGCNFH